MTIDIVEVKRDVVTGYWFAYVNQKEVSKGKSLGKCLKGLQGFVKGQE